jgi:hypothetical protein
VLPKVDAEHEKKYKADCREETQDQPLCLSFVTGACRCPGKLKFVEPKCAVFAMVVGIRFHVFAVVALDPEKVMRPDALGLAWRVATMVDDIYVQPGATGRQEEPFRGILSS